MSYQLLNQEIEIPRACPNCDGKMKAIQYDAPLKILGSRTWHICTKCNYEQQIGDFKKELMSV